MPNYKESVAFYVALLGWAPTFDEGSQNLVDAVKKNICGKVHRMLVPGSLEVHPLKTYGAVEGGKQTVGRLTDYLAGLDERVI